MSFDPNATGNKNFGVFSLPFTEKESELIFLPVPWEVTTSYGDGCSHGPQAILEASKQLDLCDVLYGEFYKRGIFQRETNLDLLRQSENLKKIALSLKERLELGEELTGDLLNQQEIINHAGQALNEWVYQQSKDILDQNKFCAVIGGDHSVPFGLMRALKEKHSDLSILQIDAHMDLRKSYQGYLGSHASIMNNAIGELEPYSLVQMGIRDFCPEEMEMAQKSPYIHTYYDANVTIALARGESWQSIVAEAIGKLSNNIYISFDIDGLTPDLCPHTGTPVPGGISFQQMEALLYLVSTSGKKIVGFDLCEVSPGSNPKKLDCWDANVGARVLFKLAGALLGSNNKSHK